MYIPTIADAMAELERWKIRQRTRDVLAVKAARGEQVGQVPLGYLLVADGVHLDADAVVQAVVGGWGAPRGEVFSLRAIAERLNGEVEPWRGSRWERSGVARIERREFAA